MNLGFIPSLQHMSAVKIALHLYYDTEIEYLLGSESMLPITKCYFDRDGYEFWKRIEAKAAEKLSFLPDLLKLRLSKFIRPLHFEFEQWLKYQFLSRFSDEFDAVPLLEHRCLLSWKGDGTIDKLKTTKNIVRNKNYKPEMRFAMACSYFLEEEILAIWFGDETLNLKSFVREYGTSAALQFWVNRLRNGSWTETSWKEEVDGYFKDLRISKYDNPLRIICFFSYLSREGRKNFFSYLREFMGFRDDFLLCLREMNDEERVEAISVYPSKVLLRFLLWPFQSLFIDIAKELWHLMTFNQFEDVLNFTIHDYILKGFVDFDYVELVREFWLLSPASYKREMKRRKRLFKLIEVTLNYDEKNASKSLPELLEDVKFVCERT